jgi:hypothetical protein
MGFLVSLVRVQTLWTGIAGSPYYTNLYAIGPLATNNGNDLATAWRVFLTSLTSLLASPMVATIDPELLEFDETTGAVTGAGSTTQAPVPFSGLGDQLPHANQALVQWTTNGIVHNRRVRGRTFIPGCLEAQNGPTGDPSAVIGGPLQSAIDALLVSMSGRMRIWSQPLSDDPPSPTNPNRPGSAWAVQSGKVSPKWAVLRSRRD